MARKIKQMTVRIQTLLPVLALIVLAWGARGAEKPIFRVGFDESFEPERSADSSPVKVYQAPRFRDGVRGSAVLVDSRNRLEYGAKGNWPQDAGTMIFYLAAANWTPGVENYVFSVTPGKQSGEDLLIYKLSDAPTLAFLLRNELIHQVGSARTGIENWRTGEFHQIAVIWDRERVRCCVDGMVQGEFPRFEFPAFDRITVGTPYPGWSHLGDEAVLVDELEIYDRAFTPDELKACREKIQAVAESEAPLNRSSSTPGLYIPFEKTLDAKQSSLVSRARTEFPAECRYGDGVAGQALELGGRNFPSVYYTGESLPNPRAGSCVIWVKPDWMPACDEVYFLVAFLGEKGRVLLYKPHETAEFSLLAEDNRIAGGPLAVRSAAEKFRPGEWVMLAFTWDEHQMKFYIDGEAVGSIAARTVPWNAVVVGAAYRDWPATGLEKTAFDELRIWQETLSGRDIRKIYQETQAANPQWQKQRDAAEQKRAALAENNLAARSNGGMIVASSFADYTAHGADNLIDNDPNTIWSPFQRGEAPLFLELYFRYPRTLDQVAVNTVSRTRIGAARLEAFDVLTGNFVPVKTLNDKELKSGIAAFPAVTTTRLRLWIDRWLGGGTPALSEFSAFGPPQPLPGRNEPYWAAWYIWHNEVNHTYYANEMRYLRTEFDLEDMDFVSAVLQSRSNDYFKLWLNGHPVDSGSVAITPRQVGKFLRQGRNVIAVEARINRHPGQWGWGEFLTELAINYPGHSRKIATGPEWVGSTTADLGWKEPNFNAAGWKKVYCYRRPPEGPWGRIPYTDSSVRSRTRLLSASVPPGPHRPGTALDLEFRLKQHGDLPHDYFFTVEGGFPPVLRRYGDYVFNRKIAECRDNQDGTVSVFCRFELPPWTPATPQPLRLTGYNRATGVELQLDGAPDGIVGTVEMAARPAQETPIGNARIAYPDGQAAFVVDGKIVPPLMWRAVENCDPMRNYMEYAYGGIHIKNLILYGGNIDVGSEDKFEKIFANLDRRIRSWTDVDPHGQIIVLVDLRPTPAWLDAHPGNRLVDAFGRESSIVSFGSKDFYNACSAFFRKLIERLRQQDYYPRIIGFQPWVCGVPDSCMGGVENNSWQSDRKKLTVGDFNPGALAEFRDFLRRKYQNDPLRLQKAWRRPAVTFDNAVPDAAEVTAAAPDGEVLRDPALSGAMTFDYAEFLPTLLGNFQRRLCAEIKQLTGRRKLLFVHYGFIVEHMRGLNTPAGGLNDNNYDLPAWLADDNIDGYIGAPSYSSRFSGQPHLTYFPWSSFALQNRMYLPDDDTRYFQSGTGNYGHNRSLAESRAVIRRNIGADLTRNFGSWFADMSVGRDRQGISWTGYPEIAAEIGRMNQLYAKAQRLGYQSAAEIAVVVSPESMKYLDVMRGATLMNSLIARMYYSEIFNLGAPFDIYMQSDLSLPQFPRDRYKLYIMLNSFAVSARDRQAMAKIRQARPGTTWLWFYVPGYVDPAAEQRNSTANIRSVTGIAVRKLAGSEVPAARFRRGTHPLLAQGVGGSEWTMPLMPESSLPMHPNELAPRLRIEDGGAEILAEFADGGGALAVREYPEWKSVYSVVPYLEKQFLRNLLNYAGVHLYTDAPVVFDADARFIVLNNGNTEDRLIPIHLPRTARRVSDALTGEVIGTALRDFSIRLPRTTTKILRTEW